MPQISPLVQTLKKQLKAHGKTYADIAEQLDLSEASVKRLFAEENFTLQRLEGICHFIGLEISDLVLVMANNQQRIVQLTFEQEQEIASDTLLLMVTVCIMNGLTYDELLQEYEIKETELIQKLAILDRLKVIELLPNNRIKLLIATDFSWLPNGPIQRFFMEKIEQEFFNSKFEAEHESLIVVNRLLTQSSNTQFQNKMRKLASEFNEMAQSDLSKPLSDKNGVTMVLAIRQWQYSIFDAYQK